MAQEEKNDAQKERNCQFKLTINNIDDHVTAKELNLKAAKGRSQRGIAAGVAQSFSDLMQLES